MNKYFVITSNIAIEYEGSRTSVVAVRFCTEEEIKNEITELSKLIRFPASEEINYSFNYHETPITGYSAISFPMNDIDIQKSSFYHNLNTDFMSIIKNSFSSERCVEGVLFKDYFISQIIKYNNYDLLTENDISIIYDKYVENNLFSCIESI
jgi:hypothetical protein